LSRDRPAVSVVTLTWNHGPHLAECLDSVRRQTFEDWEQVVLDDGSTDGSVDAAIGDADPRVRFLRERHRGADAIPDLYRRALAACRGRMIGFVDGDDQWTPTALERGVAGLHDGRAVLSWGCTEVFGERSRLIPGDDVLLRHPLSALQNEPVGAAALALLDPAVVMPFTLTACLLRRDVLDRIGGLQTRPGLPVMDHPTLLRLSLEGPFRYVGETVARHRVSSGTVSRREMSRIDLGVYVSIRRFRRQHGYRIPCDEAGWRRIDEGWRHRLLRRSLGRAGLQLLGEGRWGAAALLGALLLRTPWLWSSELERLRGAVARRRRATSLPGS
jgi:glycosyltransferase involved in cell wall biosynthesis